MRVEGVRVLRLVARVVGIIVAMGMALWMTLLLSPEAPGVSLMVIEPAMWGHWGVLSAGRASLSAEVVRQHQGT